MSIVNVTKNRIIKAIRNEPALAAGSWATISSAAFKKMTAKDHKFEDRSRYSQDVLENMPRNLKTKDCAVCAVGAVMREILDPKQSLNNISWAAEASVQDSNYTVASFGSDFYNLDELEETALQILQDGVAMNALSYLFEGLDSYYKEGLKLEHNVPLSGRYIGIIRKRVIKFIDKNFPKTIQIDIDGAKPAKDVKVITPKKKKK